MFHQFLDLAENISTINIDVIEGDVSTTIEDERIGITVIYIFNLFFKNIENAIIYICDSNDKRQYARKRKFDFWFTKYNFGEIIKEDGLAIIENTEILNTILVSEHDPKVKEIIAAFKMINKTAAKK